jgi:hypothetical protein
MAKEEQPIGLAIGLCLVAVWLGMGWLAWLMGIASCLMVLSNMKFYHAPAKAAPAGAAKEEEILTPVIVQDVGEPPYLYPPNFRLRIKTPWRSYSWWEEVAAMAGRGFRAAFRLSQPESPVGVRARKKRFPSADWRGA